MHEARPNRVTLNAAREASVAPPGPLSPPLTRAPGMVSKVGSSGARRGHRDLANYSRRPLPRPGHAAGCKRGKTIKRAPAVPRRHGRRTAGPLRTSQPAQAPTLSPSPTKFRPAQGWEATSFLALRLYQGKPWFKGPNRKPRRRWQPARAGDLKKKNRRLEASNARFPLESTGERPLAPGG